MDLDGQIALVTGGSGGIGRAIGARLAGEGASVALAYGRNREPAEALAIAVLTNDYLTNQVVSLDGGMHPR